MSHNASSTGGIFDGLLRPDEEEHIDQLMEEMYGEANRFDYGAWQATTEQEDVAMTDAADEDQDYETRPSEESTGTARYASTLFQENSTMSALPNNAHTSARQVPVNDLPQLTAQSLVIDQATFPGQAVLALQSGITQPAPASQAIPSSSRQSSAQQTTPAKQPSTKSQQPRPKWKVREASNAAPTFPRGTWDIPVLTCINEAKRPDGEFGLHLDHTGNQKCARILMAIFPDKFPATTDIKVLANKVSPVWNDRDRGKKGEWDRVQEMRDADEKLRKEMRTKIRATGIARGKDRM